MGWWSGLVVILGGGGVNLNNHGILINAVVHNYLQWENQSISLILPGTLFLVQRMLVLMVSRWSTWG